LVSSLFPAGRYFVVSEISITLLLSYLSILFQVNLNSKYGEVCITYQDTGLRGLLYLLQIGTQHLQIKHIDNKLRS
jgi:hypothetical protein